MSGTKMIRSMRNTLPKSITDQTPSSRQSRSPEEAWMLHSRRPKSASTRNSAPLALPQPSQSRALEVHVLPPHDFSPFSARTSVNTRVERLKPMPSTSISARAAPGVWPAASKRTKRRIEKSKLSLFAKYCPLGVPLRGGLLTVLRSNSTTCLVLLLTGRPTRSNAICLPGAPATWMPGLMWSEKNSKGRASSVWGKITRILRATTARSKSTSSHHFWSGSSKSGCQ